MLFVMQSLEKLDRELALTREIREAADRITEQSRNGIQREFVNDLVASAVVNILNEQLRTGKGLSREWAKAVVNLALVRAVEEEAQNIKAAFRYELLTRIEAFTSDRSTTIEEARGADAVADIVRGNQS